MLAVPGLPHTASRPAWAPRHSLYSHPKTQSPADLLSLASPLAVATAGSRCTPLWCSCAASTLSPHTPAPAGVPVPAGVWVGIHRNPQELVETLRAMRRQVDVSTEVGVVHDIRLQVSPRPWRRPVGGWCMTYSEPKGWGVPLAVGARPCRWSGPASGRAYLFALVQCGCPTVLHRVLRSGCCAAALPRLCCAVPRCCSCRVPACPPDPCAPLVPGRSCGYTPTTGAAAGLCSLLRTRPSRWAGWGPVSWGPNCRCTHRVHQNMLCTSLIHAVPGCWGQGRAGMP